MEQLCNEHYSETFGQFIFLKQLWKYPMNDQPTSKSFDGTIFLFALRYEWQGHRRRIDYVSYTSHLSASVHSNISTAGTHNKAREQQLADHSSSADLHYRQCLLLALLTRIDSLDFNLKRRFRYVPRKLICVTFVQRRPSVLDVGPALHKCYTNAFAGLSTGRDALIQRDIESPRRGWQKLNSYCRSDNLREVLIFANFAGRDNSRIQEYRENYYYKSATKRKKIREF